jgi:hypothetical protein
MAGVAPNDKGVRCCFEYKSLNVKLASSSPAVGGPTNPADMGETSGETDTDWDCDWEGGGIEGECICIGVCPSWLIGKGVDEVVSELSSDCCSVILGGD